MTNPVTFVPWSTRYQTEDLQSQYGKCHAMGRPHGEDSQPNTGSPGLEDLQLS